LTTITKNTIIIFDAEDSKMDGKQENFKRIAENRVNKIIDMIDSLENLTNTSYYEYSDEQVDAIFSAIDAELKKTRGKFSSKKKGKKRFEL
jgi:hypothetical protein